MNKKLSKKEQGQLTKAKIFKTAINLIDTFGYKNVSVDKICAEASVSKGGFYVHYKSKEDIIRESYYINMEDFVLSNYKKFRKKNSNPKECLMKFLLLELEFSQNVGYEVTCLSYTLNLNECIPGPSHHFSKRSFTSEIRDLLLLEESKLNLSIDDAFLYLESCIRGLMASWCFSNNTFNIYEKGESLILNFVNSIYI